MSEVLLSIYNVIERSGKTDYMTGGSSDRYFNIPNSNNNDNKNSFEGFKK